MAVREGKRKKYGVRIPSDFGLDFGERQKRTSWRSSERREIRESRIGKYVIICGKQGKGKEAMKMGVVIDMPATIVQEANEYAERNGCSFRDLLCLSVEMYLAEQTRKRKAEVSAWTERFNALLDSTESRNDEPYKFNRADAYEPEVTFA